MTTSTGLRRIGLALILIFVTVFAALSLWHGSSAAWADASALHARSIVDNWRDGNGAAFTPQLWQDTHDDLQAALRTTPGNPQLLDDLGFLYAARAQGFGTPDPGSQALQMQQQLLANAAVSYRAATDLRPTFPYSWAYLALVKHLQGQRDTEFWVAFDKAVQYGTNEAGVQPALGQIAFAQWSSLGPDRQRRIEHMVNTAQAASKARLLIMAEQNGVTLRRP